MKISNVGVAALGARLREGFTRTASICVAAGVLWAGTGFGSGTAVAVEALEAPAVFAVNTGPGELAQDAVGVLIEELGGSVISRYAEFGVIIAESSASSFPDAMRASGLVDSIGRTRAAAMGDKGTGGVSAGDAEPHVAKSDDQSLRADPREATQWNMAAIDAPAAWEVSTGVKEVVVGVLDSGIDIAHPDLSAQVDPGMSVGCTSKGVPDTAQSAWVPSTSRHGTHVAGIIGAARNGVGVVGVAPDTTLASVKVVDDDGMIYPEYAICGIVWAAQHGFAVTNNSFYVDPWQFWCEDDLDQAAALEAIRRAYAWSTARGTLSVSSAGNSAYDLANKTTDSDSPTDATPIPDRPVNGGCISAPAEFDDVLAVSSIQRDFSKAPSSNFGLGVIDFTAPGADVLSTVPGGWAYMSGTSMASPHVAGTAALLAAAYPDATPGELRGMLGRGADRMACPDDDDACLDPGGAPYFGSGRVNAFAATTVGLKDVVVAVPGGRIRAGAPFTVNVAGYDIGERVSLSIPGTDATATANADPRGLVDITVRVAPETPAGPLTVRVEGSRGRWAEASVLVTPPLAAPRIDSPSGGDTLTSGAISVMGRGERGAQITVRVDSGDEESAATVHADSVGRFTLTVQLPAGRHAVRAQQTLGDGTQSLTSEPTLFTVVDATNPGGGGDGGGGVGEEPDDDAGVNQPVGGGGLENVGVSRGVLAYTGAEALIATGIVAVVIILVGSGLLLIYRRGRKWRHGR